MEGVITDANRGAIFKVKIDGSDQEVIASPAGRIRLHRIKLLPGDRVKCEFSTYDLSRCLIIWNLKNKR